MNIAPVSVIIPCYRCHATLPRAIESILYQTMLPAEVILIEDCSEDGGLTQQTMNSLRDMHPEINIRLEFLKKNFGPGGARNIGWGLATQPLIAFLDADDSWHTKKIEIQYGWMRDHPEVDLTGHLSSVWKGAVQPLNGDLKDACKISSTRLLFKNVFPARSIMLKRNLGDRFINDKRQAEDYLLWLTLSFNGRSLWLLNQTLSYSYKNDFGDSGLSEIIDDSNRGVLDAYRQIYHRRHITSITYFYLIMLAWLKHLRRKFIVILGKNNDNKKLSR